MKSQGLRWQISNCLSEAMLLLELKVLNIERVDTINHGLDELDLGVAETVLVGNIIGDTSLATGLATSAARLESKLLAPLLQRRQTLLCPAGQVNVDRGPHASAKVGGAGMQEAQLGVEHEVLARLGLDRVLNGLDALGQPLKDTTYIATLLHRNDSELILLIDPDEEGLGRVVENAPALRPVTLHSSSNQVLVARDEKEVVIDQLLPVLLVHAKKGVVFAGQLTRELGEGILH